MSLVGSLTGVLGYAVGLLAPFRETFDQVPQHGWHAVDGLGVIVKEYLSQIERQYGSREDTYSMHQCLTVP